MTDLLDTPVGEFDWGPQRGTVRRLLPWLAIVCGIALLATGVALTVVS